MDPKVSINSQVLQSADARQQTTTTTTTIIKNGNSSKSICATSTPIKSYINQVANSTTSVIPPLLSAATNSTLPLIANAASTITNSITFPDCPVSDQDKQLSDMLKNSTIDDDLPRLAKELKYRELFKGTSKFDGKGFQHFFLSQELKTSDFPAVRNNQNNNNINNTSNDINNNNPNGEWKDDYEMNELNSSNSGRPTSTTKSHQYIQNHIRKTSNGSNQDVNKNAIWNLSFSPDGKYLAAAGEDGVIRIWEIMSSVLDRDEMNFSNTFNAENSAMDDSLENHNGSKRKNSLRTNRRHSNSFSNGAATGFAGPNNNVENISTLSSSSSGQTAVNTPSIGGASASASTPAPAAPAFNGSYTGSTSSPYAPVFKPRPVREFYHSDSVLSIDWSKNNFLISSSIDKTVKLWHVDRPECLTEFQVDPYVTAVKFHKSDDRFFVSSSISGVVNVWSILDKEKVYEYKIGKRLTCIEFSPDSEEIYIGGECGVFYILTTKGLVHVAHAFIKRGNKTPRVTGIESFRTDNDIKVLVTTNDSRVRLFSHKEKLLNVRFKGLDNEQSTIKASINEGQDYVISGSEDGWAYIWKLDLENISKLTENNHSKFGFDLTSFFKDEDCLYKNRNYGAFHVHHSRCNSAIFAPRSTLKLLELSDDPVFDLSNKYNYLVKDINNNIDLDNNELSTAIIVTTDNGGLIRVFRRDFAYSIRKFIKSKKMKSEIQRRALSSLSITRERSRSSSHRRHSTEKHTGLFSILKHGHSHSNNNNHGNNINNNNHGNHHLNFITNNAHQDGAGNDSYRGRDAYNNYSLMEKPQLATSIVNVLANKKDKLNPLSPQTSFFSRNSIDDTVNNNNNNNNNNASSPPPRSSIDTSSHTLDSSILHSDDANRHGRGYDMPMMEVDNDDILRSESLNDDGAIQMNFKSHVTPSNTPINGDYNDDEMRNKNSNISNVPVETHDDELTAAGSVTKCSNCNGEKFTAKHDHNDKINFYCDSCGKRLI